MSSQKVAEGRKLPEAPTTRPNPSKERLMKKPALYGAVLAIVIVVVIAVLGWLSPSDSPGTAGDCPSAAADCSESIG